MAPTAPEPREPLITGVLSEPSVLVGILGKLLDLVRDLPLSLPDLLVATLLLPRADRLGGFWRAEVSTSRRASSPLPSSCPALKADMTKLFLAAKSAASAHSCSRETSPTRRLLLASVSKP